MLEGKDSGSTEYSRWPELFWLADLFQHFSFKRITTTSSTRSTKSRSFIQVQGFQLPRMDMNLTISELFIFSDKGLDPAILRGLKASILQVLEKVKCT